MLNLRKVLGAKPKEHVEAKMTPLLTPWGEGLDVGHVLEEHPDPQFARERFRVLNGVWACAFATSGHEPTDDLAEVVRAAVMPADDAFSQDIVVPFSPEALLSGVGRQLQPDELLWCRRTFEAPALEGGRLLLHFQAVDYACAVRVNGHVVGTHVGGYIPFAFDVTDYLAEGANELAVCVADPSEFGGRLRGKQRFDRGDIWYTAQSGMWQTVWMEVVPASRIQSVKIEADPKTGIIAVGAHLSIPNASPAAGAGDTFTLEVFDADGQAVGKATCTVSSDTCAEAVHVPDAHLWSPDDPYLYPLRLTFGDDVVQSYCAFRSVEMRTDGAGHRRVFLNGKPLFLLLCMCAC